MTRKKPTPLKSLRKKAWKVFSEYIRKRDKGRCICCGKRSHWKLTHASHFIHSSSLDFSEIGINASCPRCNTFLHGNLAFYSNNLVKIYGEEVLDYLIRESKKVRKYSREDLEDIIKKYGGANERKNGKENREDI